MKLRDVRGSVRVAAAEASAAAASRAASTSAAGARPRAPATNATRTGARQAQRISQEPGGVFAGCPVNAPFQIADRPRGKARHFRQFLLRQAHLTAQQPQQFGETQHRLLGHRPNVPSPARCPQPPAHSGKGRPRQRHRSATRA